jgi:branched-subunit amino acid aminotransferase/4-amino-4-deoxychorismate lyase
MEMAKDQGLEVETGFYSLYDFTTADEVFMTNTVAGVMPVTNIDGWAIGSGKTGPVTRRFARTYFEWLEAGKHGTQCFPEAWQK